MSIRQLEYNEKVGDDLIPVNSNQIKADMRRVLARESRDLPLEWYDLAQVMVSGAAKHGENSWLEPDNKSLEPKANHASMSRHLAEVYSGVTKDKESGLHPALHLATRALMMYTRYCREIDKPKQKFIWEHWEDYDY